MPKLHFTDRNFEGRVYELVIERTTVGRGEHNTLVLADDSVSVNHCDILMHGDEVIVRERGSSNGTFVDGVRVQGQMPVHNGQVLRFGSVEARVQIEPAKAHETSTDLTAVYEYGKVMREQRRDKKKAAGAHHRLEPSSGHVGLAEEQTVLLPNPRATQKIAPPGEQLSPDAAHHAREGARGAQRPWYLIACLLVLLAVIITWLLRRN